MRVRAAVGGGGRWRGVRPCRLYQVHELERVAGGGTYNRRGGVWETLVNCRGETKPPGGNVRFDEGDGDEAGSGGGGDGVGGDDDSGGDGGATDAERGCE
jgi:hypothetical protein